MGNEREHRSSSGAKDSLRKKEEGIEDMRPDLVEHGLEMYGHEGLEWEIRTRGVYLVEQTIELDLEDKDQHAAKRAKRPRGSAPSTIGPQRARDEDGLAGQLVAGGNTVSQERREKEDPEEFTKEAGKQVSEAAQDTAEGVGAVEKLAHVKGGGAGLKVATQIARLPHVIHLVKAGKYQTAVDYIRDGLGYADYVEVIKLVAEHAGIEFAEIAARAPWLAKVGKGIALGAEAADIVLVGIEFQINAMKALQKAHEEGERDNRIYLYATAWAHSFLYGSYSNPGVVDEKQIAAVADGVSDGKATAGNCGEKAAKIGKQLLEQYGNPRNVESALVDVLLKRAGIEGIKLHEGR